MERKKKEEYTKKTGDYPINSRITVDYSGKEPKIEFGYPEKETQIKYFRNSSGFYLFNLILSAFILVLLLGTYYQYQNTPFLTHCNLYGGNNTGYDFIIIGCIDSEYGIHTYPLNYNRIKQTYDNDSLYFVYASLIFLALYYFITPLFLSLFFRKTKIGQKWYPLLNKVILNKHHKAEFTSVPDSKVIELPLFSNVYLDYETDGKFSDYLQKIEIVEHDFMKYVISKGPKDPNKRTLLERLFNKKREEMADIYLWKAKFTFKKQPKNGFLRIKWT